MGETGRRNWADPETRGGDPVTHDPLENLGEEFRDHIEREARDNIDRGMTPEEARAAALRKFGNVTRAIEETRAVWRPAWIEQLAQDFRHGTRLLRRNPAFTLVVVLTLALGIGLSTAVFSIVTAVLIRPLPYPDPERLVWVADENRVLKSAMVAGVDYLDWSAQAKSFEEMVAYGYFSGTLQTEKDSQPHWFAETTGRFWNLSGARPALGHLFTAGERDALVLSDGLFERQFGRDASVIGKTVTLSGRPVTIVGVLPPDFRFVLPQSLQGLDSRGPSSKDIAGYLLNPITPGSETRHGPMSIELVAARLKPGVSVESAQAELAGIQERIARQNPGMRYDMMHVQVLPLQEKLVGAARQELVILLGAVGFVLLIACVNIASLLLARAGAGQARVLRQFSGENLGLALLGGGAGLLVARWAVAALVRLAPQSIPRLQEANVDWRVALLGAQRGEVVWMIVRQGMRTALIGTGVGLGAAFGLTHLMAGLLYEVKPFDPATYAAVALILVATALLASSIPARKAAQVDPLTALRYE